MRKAFLSILLLTVVSTTSVAENNIRPGLWEVTTKSDLLALMPHIPPQQMQQITSLAKQYGLEIPKIQNDTATSEVCIIPEMADQEIPTYFYDNQSGCTVKNATRTGNRYRMDLVCKNAQFQGNGSAEGVFTSAESFTGQTEFDSVVQGNPVYAHADTQGRWIGEYCTIVKPLP